MPMKRYLSIIIITITLLSLCACSSDNSQNSDSNSTAQSSAIDQTDADNDKEIDDTYNSDKLNNSENTVLIRYFRQRKELPYNDDIKGVLDNIKACEDKPKTEFEHKIGSIAIIYSNNEGSEDFANIYIGKDDNIYARYINSADEEIAYKLDIEALGLE